MRRIAFFLILVPALLAPGPCEPPPTGVERAPYLQLATPTSVVVRWTTTEATDSVVRYGTSPDALDQAASVPGLALEHEVRLTGLVPDDRYWYAVGSSRAIVAGGDGQHYFDTPPPVGSEAPLRIWALGDSGTADANADAVRDAYLDFTGDTYTDVWLMLGDNAYSDGTYEEYQAAVFDTYPQVLRTTALWPTIGNHDAKSSWSFLQAGPYFELFTLPTAGEAGGVPSGTEAYYSFDHGNVHFVCLDSSGTLPTPEGPMLTWLEADLAANTLPWVIAFWHHPPYSKGSHDSDTTGDMISIRVAVLPILEDLGVDLVLTGHSHGYERSMLMDSHYGFSGSLDPSMILDDGDGDELGDGAYVKPSYAAVPHEGAVYVVAGSSGKVSTNSPYDHPIMVASLPELGSLVIDVDGPRMDVRFLRESGAVDDRFTLLKGP